jgi:hypothetical protein
MGSIVVTPSKPIVTSRRLGSAGWRLTDTKHGKAVRRKRNAVTTNKPSVERVLPTLDDDTALALVAKLATTNDTTQPNLNVHDK